MNRNRDELKPIAVYVTPEVKKQFRLSCMRDDMTMNETLKGWIAMYLRKHGSVPSRDD